MTSEIDIEISYGQSIMGKKKYGAAALNDTMQKWESVMLTFSRAGPLKQSHEKKLQMNHFKSTFASTINVKMIMTKTSDFFSRFKGTGLVTKCTKSPTSRCQFKITPWNLSRGYLDIINIKITPW